MGQLKINLSHCTNTDGTVDAEVVKLVFSASKKCHVKLTHMQRPGLAFACEILSFAGMSNVLR